MWDKIKLILITVLATLGVLFIIIMLMPDDEDDYEESGQQQTIAVPDAAPDDAYEADEAADDDDSDWSWSLPDNQDDDYLSDEPGEGFSSAAQTLQSQSAQTSQSSQTSQETSNSHGTDAVTVSIPASEISGSRIKFRTVSLDDREITQDIFSDYDLTIVHVWGTYCQPCIREMGDYAALYDKLPSNVNLIAIVCDVYDGIDNNVSSAKSILSDAGAGFMNLRNSDDLYGVISGLQYIPSSFFVDSEGRIIGEMMDGAGYEDTVKQLSEYISQ